MAWLWTVGVCAIQPTLLPPHLPAPKRVPARLLPAARAQYVPAAQRGAGTGLLRRSAACSQCYPEAGDYGRQAPQCGASRRPPAPRTHSAARQERPFSSQPSIPIASGSSSLGQLGRP